MYYLISHEHNAYIRTKCSITFFKFTELIFSVNLPLSQLNVFKIKQQHCVKVFFLLLFEKEYELKSERLTFFWSTALNNNKKKPSLIHWLDIAEQFLLRYSTFFIIERFFGEVLAIQIFIFPFEIGLGKHRVFCCLEWSLSGLCLFTWLSLKEFFIYKCS